MVIGIVVGSYSSIFVAAPLLLYLERRYGAKPSDTRASGGRGTPGRAVGAPKNVRA
jgi:hypothetical protein